MKKNSDTRKISRKGEERAAGKGRVKNGTRHPATHTPPVISGYDVEAGQERKRGGAGSEDRHLVDCHTAPATRRSQYTKAHPYP